MNSIRNWYDDPRLINWETSANQETIPHICVSYDQLSLKIFDSKDDLLNQVSYKEATPTQITNAALQIFQSAALAAKKRLPNLIFKLLKCLFKNEEERKEVVLNPTQRSWTPKSSSQNPEISNTLTNYDLLTNEAFLEAAKRGDFEWVNNILNDHVSNLPKSLEHRDIQGRTPLHLAALHGHLRIVRLLLDHDDLTAHYKDNEGKTPYQLAQLQGHKEIVEILPRKIPTFKLEEAIEIFKFFTDEEHEKSIKSGIYEKGERCCKFFIESLNEDGRYSEILKIVSELCQLFIEAQEIESSSLQDDRKKLKLDQWNEALKFKYKPILHKLQMYLKMKTFREAIIVNNFIRFEIIFKKMNNIFPSAFQLTADTDIEGNNPLHLAAKLDRQDFCELILKNPFLQYYLRSANFQRQVPAHLSALQGNVETFNTMFHKTIELMKELEDKPLSGILDNFRDINGKSPLHLAAQEGHTKICRSVLKYSERLFIMQKDNGGNSPIHLAALKGHHKVVRLLLKELFLHRDEGEEKELKDRTSPTWVILDSPSGKTPLHLAAQEGHMKVCSVILKHEQAQELLKWEDNEGHLPTYFAAQGMHVEAYSVIYEALKNVEKGKSTKEISIKAVKPKNVVKLSQISLC